MTRNNKEKGLIKKKETCERNNEREIMKIEFLCYKRVREYVSLKQVLKRKKIKWEEE